VKDEQLLGRWIERVDWWYVVSCLEIGVCVEKKYKKVVQDLDVQSLFVPLVVVESSRHIIALFALSNSFRLVSNHINNP